MTKRPDRGISPHPKRRTKEKGPRHGAGGLRATRKKREAPCAGATPYPPTDCTAVLSAKRGLTAGFGMGPGDPPLYGRARAGRSRAVPGAHRATLEAAQRTDGGPTNRRDRRRMRMKSSGY